MSGSAINVTSFNGTMNLMYESFCYGGNDSNNSPVLTIAQSRRMTILICGRSNVSPSRIVTFEVEHRSVAE